MAAIPANVTAPVMTEIALLGGGLTLLLGLMYGLLARRIRAGWPWWLAAGFGSYGLAMTVAAVQPFSGRPPALLLTSLVALPYVFISVGIWQFTAAGRLRRDPLLWGLVGYIVGAIAMQASLGLPLPWMVALASAVWVAWAARFLWHQQRRRDAWQALNAAVCLLQPVFASASLMGALPAGVARTPALLPLVALGISLLVTSLVQLQQREAESHARVGEALRQQLEAEAALQELGTTIEQRMALRFNELNATVAELESFNRQVSHDLRGPLGTMAQVAGLARQRISAGDSDSALRMLTVLQRQAQLSFEAVDALLWLARAEQAPLQWGLVDTRQLVEELCELLVEEGRLPTKAVTIGALPVLHADAALLRQLFRNLLTNAAKFARPGVPLQVQVQARTEGTTWVFEVRDNGRGFSAGDAQRIFRPFERADVQPGSDGIGVGLSIVQRIVQRHGGRVEAEGQPGSGAVFRFMLQAGAAPAPRQGEAANPTPTAA